MSSNGLGENDKRKTRKRKPPAVYFNQEETQRRLSGHFQDWTHQEKIALLEALKKYGHYDMYHLREAVPSRSEHHIKMAISMWWKTSRILMSTSSSGEKRNKDKLKLEPKRGRGRPAVPRSTTILGKAPVDRWLIKLEASQPNTGYPYPKLLSRVFLYISKFEDHPPPDACGGVDYRAVYEYLYCMLNGYPSKTLNKESANFILQSLNDVALAIKERGVTRETIFLDRLQRIPGQLRQYGGKKPPAETGPLPEAKTLHELVKIPGFNPLNVPFDLLKY